MLATIRDTYALMNTAKITVYVVDESGKPVENAEVGVGFGENSQRKERPVDGFTKSDGRFSASEACNSYVGFRVKKSGYYMSTGQYIFNYEKKGSLRWEPWNPEIKVEIRKIENPVPMYARDTNESRINIPVIGKEVGFDLIAYDWVKPYGKGKVADLSSTLHVRNNGSRDAEYKVKINFPGQFNGIQSLEEDLMYGSEFKLPRFAPIAGYQKNMNVFIEFKPGGGGKWSFKKNKNYTFRIRSEVEKGKLIKAMYGKILGDIDVGTNMDGTAFLKFKYYLNPDYTRNLEFDPARNLFLNLPPREQVRIK
jgi:hypothetical protein